MGDHLRVVNPDEQHPLKFVASTGDRTYSVRIYHKYTEVYLKQANRGLRRDFNVYGIDHRAKASRLIQAEIEHHGNMEV